MPLYPRRRTPAGRPPAGAAVRRYGRLSVPVGHHQAARRVRILLVLAGLILSGCGEPPELRAASSGLPTVAATPSTSGPEVSPSVAVPPIASTPSPSADAGLVAVACRGEPSAQQIINLVRGRAGLLPRNAKVQASDGPLCAAEWQFTAIDVTGYEPLHVVTRKQAGTLRLVTAGTDVCSVEVRVTAPPGLRRLACGDDAPVTVPSPTTPAATPSAATPTSGA